MLLIGLLSCPPTGLTVRSQEGAWGAEPCRCCLLAGWTAAQRTPWGSGVADGSKVALDAPYERDVVRPHLNGQDDLVLMSQAGAPAAEAVAWEAELQAQKTIAAGPSGQFNTTDFYAVTAAVISRWSARPDLLFDNAESWRASAEAPADSP